MSDECAIIGGGPAGTACAIQLKRHGIDPILFEKNEIGGLLRNANRVENYPGFSEGIDGIAFTNLMKSHLVNAGIHPIFETVVKCEWQDDFIINTNKKDYKPQYVVIASGTIPNEDFGCVIPENVRDKVFYEIVPILEITNKTTAIIGAGDAAFDYALNLSQNNDVVILNRSDRGRCLPILWERTQSEKKIRYRPLVDVQKIELQNGRLVLSLFDRHNQESFSLTVDYLIPAIGRRPCLDFMGTYLREHSEELTHAGRLFFIGDVKNGLFRQTAISCGDGIKAAMCISSSIDKENSQ